MRRSICVVSMLAVVCGIAFTDVPQSISYQGVLTDGKTGAPLLGVHAISFRLYDCETGGMALWQETHPAVSVNNGLFNVMLGSVAPFAPLVDFSHRYWLEVSVDGDIMEPRYQLGASPYALNVRDNAITTDKIADGHVTQDDIHGRVVFAEIQNEDGEPEFVLTNRNSQMQIVGSGAANVKFDGENKKIIIDVPKENLIEKDDDEWISGASLIYAADLGDDVGIGTDDPSAKLHVSGGTGSVEFLLEADTDNSGESDQPKITLSQDGGAIAGELKFEASTNNIMLINNAGGAYLNLREDGHVRFEEYVSIGVNGPDAQLCLGKANYGGAGPTNGPQIRMAGEGNTGSNAASGADAYKLYIQSYDNDNSSNFVYPIYVIDENNNVDFWLRARGPSVDSRAYFAGDVGIGTTSPEFKLSLDNDGAIIAKGTYGSGDDLATSGAGTRLIWYPKKAAFRAGGVLGGEWNNANIGDYSVAFGRGSEAKAYGCAVLGGFSNVAGTGGVFPKGNAVVAGGTENRATNAYSAILGGYDNHAIGLYSVVAGGKSNYAGGDWSAVAGGNSSAAGGQYSFATNNGSNASKTNSAAFNSTTTTAPNQTRVNIISKASVSSFSIDHPQDPLSTILNHFCIESPEIMLIYRGAAIIGDDGTVDVFLPEYFDTLNRNPMVQLTGVGTSDVYVAEKVEGNRFVIGGVAGTEVYWMVTGERKDQNAEIIKLFVPVEQPKSSDHVGHSYNDDVLAIYFDYLIELDLDTEFDFLTEEGRAKYERIHEAAADTTE